MNILTNSYNNIFLDPSGSYFETALFFVKPIGSVNDFFTFNYIRFTQQKTMQSFADFFIGNDIKNSDKGIIQLHEHQEPCIFLDRQKLGILTHQNIIQKSDRLLKNIKIDFVSTEHRDTIFEADGVDQDGLSKAKIKDYSKNEHIISKTVNLLQQLPTVKFERSEIYKYMFNAKEAV